MDGCRITEKSENNQLKRSLPELQKPNVKWVKYSDNTAPRVSCTFRKPDGKRGTYSIPVHVPGMGEEVLANLVSSIEAEVQEYYDKHYCVKNAATVAASSSEHNSHVEGDVNSS